MSAPVLLLRKLMGRFLGLPKFQTSVDDTMFVGVRAS
jgi:hypothetical protein